MTGTPTTGPTGAASGCTRCGAPDNGQLRALSDNTGLMCWSCRITASAARRNKHVSAGHSRDHISRQLRRTGRPQRRRQR